MSKKGKYHISDVVASTMADNPCFVSYSLTDLESCGNKRFEKNLTITWSKLSMEVGHGQAQRKTLSSFSGHLHSGELVAVMGPSGSGKTTFLKCLALKQRPTIGHVNFYSATQKCDFSYVAQTDDLYVYLTVEESLLFASRFKNDFDSQIYHAAKVKEVIEQFRLEKCAKNIVNRCSGGEVRRLSIALEMVSDPDMVVMDEPTTGLDSFTALSVLQTLKEAVTTNKPNRQLAVLMTIHQPNTELFFMFDRVFFLSVGHCIYGGCPKDIPAYLRNFELYCPPSSNPADFLMDIACKGPENEKVQILHYALVKQKEFQVDEGLVKIDPTTQKRRRNFLDGFMVNIHRLFLSTIRDPLQSVSRLLMFLFFPLFILVFSTGEGLKTSSCVYRFNDTHVNPENSYEMFDRRKLGLQSVFYIVFNAFFTLFCSSFPATFSFTLIIRSLIKEYRNNWYTFNAFFFSFVVVQMLFAAFYSFANSLALYILAPAWFTWRTFAFFALINCCLAIFGDALGFFGGTIFARNTILAVMLVVFIQFNTTLMSDFMIQALYLHPNINFVYQFSSFYHSLKLMLHMVFPIEPCRVPLDKIFTIRKMQDFIRFFRFDTGHNDFDDLEDVHETEWEQWEEIKWTIPNMTNFMIERYCPKENGTCPEGLKCEIDTFLNKRVNMVANEYLLIDVDVVKSLQFCLGLVLIHYVVCYIVAFLRAKSK